jgi:diguanylate cyclase
MAGAVARAGAAGVGSRRLYAQIGEFLEAQRLEPDPANYAFAHAILNNPNGPLAKAVAALTDGGVRLTIKDIEDLGVEVSTTGPGDRAKTEGLVAQTQMQVEGFHDVVAGLHAETQDFGRDLAAGADAIRAAVPSGVAALEDVVRITATMVTRVQSAEAQLEHATREAAELRAKLEEARDNARRDPLTELPNRRAFEERYAEDVATGAPVWMAVCDVDHFKSVNDRFGHAVGDRVLKAIGAALTEACAGHFVARYGGEEFVVLLRGLDGSAARAMLETARVTVENKRYKLRESDQPLGAVTISSGLTLARAGEGVRTVFGRSDALLYRAKSDGRNCVRVD